MVAVRERREQRRHNGDASRSEPTREKEVIAGKISDRVRFFWRIALTRTPQQFTIRLSRKSNE